MLMIMSFLLRVSLPDRPGALGLVATALGTVEADIVSVDVIERGTGYAVDDMVVQLPPGRLPDTLVSAAATVEGVRVESIRPYAAAFDPNRELELIDALVADRTDALPRLAEGVTRIFRAGWTLVVGEPQEIDGRLYANVLAGCPAAPEVDRVHRAVVAGQDRRRHRDIRPTPTLRAGTVPTPNWPPCRSVTPPSWSAARPCGGYRASWPG